MPDNVTEPPEGWTTRSGDDTTPRTLLTLEYPPEQNPVFRITADARPDTPAYTVRLSTIPTDTEHARHDFHVTTAETRDDATAAAIALAHEIPARIENGTISARNPALETIQELIDDTHPNTAPSLIERLAGRFR